MIQATFFHRKTLFGGSVRNGFSISGHAGYSESGKDIVCAAASAMMLMTVNGITEVVGHPAFLQTGENEVILKLRYPDAKAQTLLDSFFLQLSGLELDYPEHIKLSDLEV